MTVSISGFLRYSRSCVCLLSSLLLSACVVNTTNNLRTEPILHSNGQTPELCLALSGGGLRAGTVALGVLQEFHLTGFLPSVDVVASVSGGGYPVYGLLVRMQRDGEPLGQLLSENSAYVQNVKSTPFLDYPNLTSKLLVTIPFTPLNFVTRPLSGISEVGLVNTASTLYAKSIHDTFYKSGLWNRRTFFLRDIQLDQLRRQGFPYPIFVTAANRGHSPPLAKHRYDVSDLFELSPMWVGSKSFGYFTPAPALLNIWHASVASAAAVDSPRTRNCVSQPGKENCPRAEVEDNTGVPDMFKVLGVGGGVPLRLKGAPIYLSDGGFIENLAVLPLLRQGCSKIIAVDSSHDPNLRFENLYRLKGYVSALGGEVDDKGNLDQSDRSLRENTGWDQPRNHYSLRIRMNDRWSRVELLKLGLSQSLIRAKGTGKPYPRSVVSYARKNWLPDNRKSKACGVDYPQTILGDAPRCGKVEGGYLFGVLDDGCSFPFEETFRLCYEADETQAYIDLGRHMACQYLTQEESGLECAIN